jgi:hypothetical protein
VHLLPHLKRWNSFQQTPWSTVLLENLIVIQQINLWNLMVHYILHNPDHEPDESNPYPHTLHLNPFHCQKLCCCQPVCQPFLAAH